MGSWKPLLGIDEDVPEKPLNGWEFTLSDGPNGKVNYVYDQQLPFPKAVDLINKKEGVVGIIGLDVLNPEAHEKRCLKRLRLFLFALNRISHV